MVGFLCDDDHGRISNQQKILTADFGEVFFGRQLLFFPHIQYLNLFRVPHLSYHFYTFVFCPPKHVVKAQKGVECHSPGDELETNIIQIPNHRLTDEPNLLCDRMLEAVLQLPSSHFEEEYLTHKLQKPSPAAFSVRSAPIFPYERGDRQSLSTHHCGT